MEPIQSLLPAAVTSVVRPAPLSPEKVLFAWRVAVGPALARVTRVRLGADRALEVSLDDPRFAQEIVRSTSIVLGRLQELLGRDAVRRLAVRPPEGARSGRRARSAPGVRSAGKHGGEA
jgi:hypothetical protein